MKVARGLVLAWMALLCPRLAWGIAQPPKPTEGLLTTRDGKQVIEVPLKHTKVAIHVVGYLADVEVEQTFQNPYKNKIETTYLFPLPTHAAVNQMDIVSGGRTVAGKIMLRENARQAYKVAVEQGRVAALLTQERPNLFTQAVGNIEPGAEVVVRLRYVEALSFEDGGYEVVFPMVAGPRHVPATSKLTAEAAAALQAPALPPGLRSSHDIEVAVDVDAGVAVGVVTSPSHQVVVARDAAFAARAQIALAAGDTVPNKDFILRYQVAGQGPGFALLSHRASPAADGSFYLLAEPPAAAAAEAVTPKEMVFVLDTSSSMRGRPLAAAKRAVRQALESMNPDDTFQIIRFDDGASALGARPIANKPKNVALALQWLDALDADGGTDMATGVRAALEFPHDPARLRIVAFLTDGYIGNEDEILALVQEKVGESRLFSFGVGTAVNRYLLEEMATVGRGAVQVVRPDEDPAAAVARFTARLARPVLTDVTIDWNGLAVKDLTPARVPDLFVGQPIVVSGRYAHAGAGTVTIHGKSAGREVSFDVPVTLPEVDTSRPAVATVWARARIAELTRRQLRGEKPELKGEIIGLALANRLVTPYTAFLAVDTSKVTKGGKAELVAVPVEVPDGVDRARVRTGDSGVLGTVGVGDTSGSYAHATPSKVYAPIAIDEYGGGPVGGYAPGRTVTKSEDPVITTPRPPADRPEAERAEGKALKSAPATVAVAKDEEVARAAASYQGDVMKCYTKARASSPKLAGKLTVHMVVGPDGAVTEYVLKELPGNDAELATCVSATVEKWRFAKSPARARAADASFDLGPGKER